MHKFSEGKIPRHLAIIMDGNGRWAKKRNLPRSEGHRVGIEKLREVTQICLKLGIKILTLYAFSCQNWKRPQGEVDFLMKSFENYLTQNAGELNKKGIQMRVIGRRRNLSSVLQEKIERVEKLTSNNKKLIFNLAINYGGQEEIIDAVKKIIREVKKGTLSSQKITPNLFRQYLYVGDLPYPDLLIRTGGEYRISNFLLWEIAYTELWITPVFWPDFGEEDLREALKDYAKRERRFGGLKE